MPSKASFTVHKRQYYYKHSQQVRRIMMVLVVIAFVFSCLVSTTHASCVVIDEAPTLQEEFVSAEMVARLARSKSGETTMELPCGIFVYDGDYVIIDELDAYEVLEVFKGDTYQEGDDMPLVWWTDTGYRQNIPSYVTGTNDEDDDGFLAILRGRRVCQNETNTWIYEEDDEPVPFELSECSYSNKPWSSVSDEEKEWLRQQAVTGGNTSTPAPSPTTVDITAPTLQSSSQPSAAESFCTLDYF